MISIPEINAVFGDRIHIDDVPQNAIYPCARMIVVSDYPRQTQSGTGSGKALLQLDVLSLSRVEVGSAGEVLRGVYDGYRGQIGEFTTRIFVKNLTSDWIENAKVYTRMVELEVGYVRQK
jgi:hypothetical protein